MHTLGSHCVYISEIFKPYHLPRRVKPVKNRPEDDYLLVETCSLHITLCNKNSCADVQISITIRIQALRDVFIQIQSVKLPLHHTRRREQHGLINRNGNSLIKKRDKI